MSLGLAIDMTKIPKRPSTVNARGKKNQALQLIMIDFSLIYNLSARDYYRLMALQLISQLAKLVETNQPLNIPVPDCPDDYWEFTQQLFKLNIGRLMICLNHTQILSPVRREEINQFIKDVKNSKEFGKTIKLIKITWMN